jgi:hypothetical protein
VSAFNWVSYDSHSSSSSFMTYSKFISSLSLGICIMCFVACSLDDLGVV